jgi:hypothetical protein
MSLHYDEKGKFFTDYVSKDAISAIIQTITHRIRGNLYLRSGERVSDMLNRAERFLAVTDATLFDAAGEKISTVDFVAVNTEHIIWLTPEENHAENGGGEGGS